MGFDYSEKIKINKNRLDDEAVRCPSDFYEVATMEANLSEDRDTLKTNIDTAKSKAELRLRSLTLEQINEKFSLNLSKITESTITALVNDDDDVRRVMEEFSSTKRAASLVKAARRGLEVKQNMLDMLSYLHGAGYFYSDPTRGQLAHTQRSKVPQKLIEKANSVEKSSTKRFKRSA